MNIDDQNKWNILATIFFFALLVFALGVLSCVHHGRLPTYMPLADFVLISLATFRFVRLVVYDKVAQWFRDIFIVRSVTFAKNGEAIVKREQYPNGPLRTISELLACPWCFGIWAGFSIVFLYYLSPIFWLIILALAAAGVGSFLQLIANYIGWSAEQKKFEAENINGKK